MSQHVTHPIPPVFDSHSRILILGSFPSVKSREFIFSTAIPRTVSGPSSRRCAANRFPPPSQKKKRFFCETGSRSGT